jgi:usherin
MTINFIDLKNTNFRCLRCDCNPAGSLNKECDKQTGQCECKSFVTGLKCNVCIPSTSNLNINNPFGCSKSK